MPVGTVSGLMEENKNKRTRILRLIFSALHQIPVIHWLFHRIISIMVSIFFMEIKMTMSLFPRQDT